MSICKHDWRRDGQNGAHNSFTCARCGADRLRAVEVRADTAEATLVRVVDAISYYDDINDGVAIVGAVREALGLPKLGMRR